MDGVTVVLSTDQAWTINAEVPMPPGIIVGPYEIPARHAYHLTPSGSPALRNAPFATDVVSDCDGWNRGQYPRTSVVEKRKEHFVEELFGIGRLAFGEERFGDVDFVYVLGVKLRGNAFDVADIGTRKSGNHPPPLVSRLAVGEGEEISVRRVVLALFCRRALG